MRAPHPDSSLSPQPPWTATIAGNAAPSHLPGSTRKHTLHAKQALLAPRKLNSSREPAWEEGQCWRVELRTSEGTWVPRLSPPALQRRSAPSPARREPRAPDSGNTHKQDGGSGSTPYGLAPSRAIGWSLE